jgi:Fe-S-cluster-containing dehydrogenase component/DMSO reductase anchor subunit
VRQKAFVFDINKCTGCDACQVACALENHVEPTVTWRSVHTFNPRHIPGVPSFHLSLACNHCVDPSCMKHCPALAYSKDAASGAVTIEADRCIGCRYCSWACPYDAPRFNPAAGTMEKCTLCAHRLEQGLEPTCVALCPTGALKLGDHDAASPDRRTPGFPHADIQPAIQFVPLRRWSVEPHAGDSRPAIEEKIPARISLRSEWTLILFTLVAAFLVGLYAATLSGTAIFAVDRPPPVVAALFALAGIVGMAFSTLHLGRRGRAWRAAWNWRGSWLSREVLLFSAFLIAATLSIATRVPDGATRWLVAALGFAALFSMDRIYHVTRARGLWVHSAQALPTAVLIAGLFPQSDILFSSLVVAKALSYLWRKHTFYRLGRDTRPWITCARVLVGLAGPLVLWWMGATDGFYLILIGVLVGELIDRCEFYLELDAPSPSRQMADDLASISMRRKE